MSIAVCALALLSLELAFRHTDLEKKLAAESQYVSKAGQFSGSKTGADIAITGDSRTLHGVNPFVVQDVIRAERGERLFVYNAALAGAPPMTQLAMIRRLLSHPHRPRLVLLSISPFMFSSKIFRPTARESLTTIYRASDLGAAFRAGASAEDLATILFSSTLETMRYRPRILAKVVRGEEPKPAAPIGKQGFIENGEVDARAQATRGRSRAIGYRKEMWKPATFGNEHMGFFTEALRELGEARVPAIVMNSQSASQIDLAYGPNSIYDEHQRWVRDRTKEAGVPFVDLKGNPAVGDEDYVDGDHLGGNGAARFSAWLAHTFVVPALGGRKPDRPSACKTVFDFEDPALPGFSRAGDAFDGGVVSQSRRGLRPAIGYTGARFLTSFGRSGDAATGEVTSPEFVIDGDSVRVRVSGSASNPVSVSLVVEGAEVATARGKGDETFRDAVWDTRAVRGQRGTLRIRDDGKLRSEHISVDDLAVCDGS